MINFSKSKIFLILLIVFIFGIAVASYLPLNIIQNDIWWFSGIVGSLVFSAIFWKNKYVRLISLLGLFLFLSFWRYSIGIPVNTPSKIWHYNGKVVTVMGNIVKEPDVRQKNVKYEIGVEILMHDRSDSSLSGTTALKVSGKILITTNLYPQYNYGDKIELTCELQKPEPFQGFSYDRYLARFDIYSVCYYPKLKLIEPGNINWFYNKIFNLKNKMSEIVDLGLTEPESSLARAIILGDKKGIPDDLREKFSQTGVSHIVAISGMHISILAGLVLVMLLGIGLWRKHAFYFASLFLIIYIILIGLPASAMRAGLMGFLVLLALNLGRLNKLTNSLVLAAVILLLINPRLLRDDIGFQLSFLAVLGIVYAYPLFNILFDKIKLPKFKGMRDIVNITLAAQIFTLPIIALNFSQVSIIAPITNLLILWTLPLIMVSAIMAIFLSFIIPGVSFLFFLPTKLLINYVIFVVEFLSKLPYAYLEIDYLWWGWAVLYYGVVVWVVYLIRKRMK